MKQQIDALVATDERLQAFWRASYKSRVVTAPYKWLQSEPFYFDLDARDTWLSRGTFDLARALDHAALLVKQFCSCPHYALDRTLALIILDTKHNTT